MSRMGRLSQKTRKDTKRHKRHKRHKNGEIAHHFCAFCAFVISVLNKERVDCQRINNFRTTHVSKLDIVTPVTRDENTCGPIVSKQAARSFQIKYEAALLRYLPSFAKITWSDRVHYSIHRVR